MKVTLSLSIASFTAFRKFSVSSLLAFKFSPFRSFNGKTVLIDTILPLAFDFVNG
jgi:hypothetical protein